MGPGNTYVPLGQVFGILVNNMVVEVEVDVEVIFLIT